MIRRLNDTVVENLNTLSVAQARAVASLIYSLGIQVAFKENIVRPNILATQAERADDSDMMDNWRMFVHYVDLPYVTQTDEYDNPYNLVKVD